MNRNAKRLFSLCILLLLATGFGYTAYTKMARISGSARADLEEQLTDLRGHQYTAGVLGEFFTEEGTVTLLEDLTFPPITQSRIARWNDTFPEADPAGTPLVKGGFYTVITVQAQRRWYFALDGEPLPDVQWSYLISYTAYDDNDINSKVRAVLDPESKTLTADTPSEAFLDFLSLTVAESPQLNALLTHARSFVKE